MTADAQRSQARSSPSGAARSRAGSDAGTGAAAAADTPPAAGGRSASDREADHAAIDRLADELVPALIAKLAATGLGEIEVGEGDWTVRVRRPADAARTNRRSTDRGSRAQPGHAGHAHGPAGFEGHRTPRDGRPASGGIPAGAAPVSSNGSSPAGGAPHAPITGGDDADARDSRRAVVTSPAVGVFQPRSEAKVGARVRSGERLGAVDMLGVPQEVVAPADGIVGATLAEPGEAVEYGQELLVIDLAAPRTAGGGGEADADRAADRTAG
ncbi:MAG TPA: biotin/lipoyl-containing protein [Candidatus Limnocylindrales bacterium]